MLTLERRTTCKQCGAKNAQGAERCQTCTRPLTGPINPVEQAYEDRLWAAPISDKSVKRPPFIVILFMVALLGAIGGNYFVWGLGPDWTHRIERIRPGPPGRPSRARRTTRCCCRATRWSPPSPPPSVR